MIGIIGAMEKEVKILKGLMKYPIIHTVAQATFIKGKLAGQEVVLLQSGIGKVNVAMATTLLLEKFGVTTVINTGSAGGIGETLQIGNVVISDTVVYHDVDVTGFGYKKGQIPGLPVEFRADNQLIEYAEAVLRESEVHYFKGQIATGDIFMSDFEKIKALKQDFPQVIAVEMEAAAVAQVCYQYNVPFVVLRALSDIAGKESPLSFETFLPLAAKSSSHMVVKLVETLSFTGWGSWKFLARTLTLVIFSIYFLLKVKVLL